MRLSGERQQQESNNREGVGPIRSFLLPLLVTIVVVWAVGWGVHTGPPALAHSTVELEAWVQEWIEQADISLDPIHIARYQDMVERHQWFFHPRPLTPRTYTPRAWGGSITQWVPLLEQHFPPDLVDNMLCLIRYESGGNPNAQNRSGATGLLQIMPSWQNRWPGDYFDPAWNIAMARRIYDIQGLGAWNPYNKGLCRG